MAKTIETKSTRDNQTGKTRQVQVIKHDGKGWSRKSEQTIVKENGRVISDKTQY